MMGEDGHGYCRTYGSTVPLIYPKETNLIEKIGAQLRQEFQGKIDELQRRIDHLEGKENIRSEPSIQIPDATSGHEIIRESIGDEVAPRANRSQPLKPVSLETSPSSQNDAQRVFMAKNAKSAEVVKTAEASQIAESAGPSPSRWAARLISSRNLK